MPDKRSYAVNTAPLKRKTIDKDLKRFTQLEKATSEAGRNALNIGFGLLFLIAVWIFAYFQSGADDSAVLMAAAIVGGYMAMNIGANDVANNVGPAVGSKALTLVGALIIAAIFEAAGALIAGGEVVSTISKGIISTTSIAGSDVFIWAMMSALLAAALWVNIATVSGAPVSTTHSIVGGVMGAGVAAAGVSAVNWPVMAKIAASWVVSPFLGGVIAAAVLAFIKFAVVYREDRIAAAKRWVPVLVSIMAATFAIYLVIKGFKHLWKPQPIDTALIGLAVLVGAYFVVRALVNKAAVNLENKRKSVSKLFTIPLICAAAVLSFAHGSNDVANAVGPLAAIVSAVHEGQIASKAALPLWVLAIGAIGISVGLVLFGPKIIRIVGEKITKLDQIRAFCIALSASITVIVASGLGLPVSSTHIAVGAVFGVGFTRETIANRRLGRRRNDGGIMLEDPADIDDGALFKSWRKARKRKLVRRHHLLSIIAAWLITVPASALLAAGIFVVIEAM